jgi:hypothetical protein
MPARQGVRPIKAWRYVGVYGPSLMLCAGAVRIGPARQAFWAVWDRSAGRLYERTVIGPAAARTVSLDYGRLRIRSADGVEVDLTLHETAGVETVCPSGDGYAWTRKQGGIRARGTVRLPRTTIPLDARAIVDDTAAYYKRHVHWQWCAGIGVATDGRSLAWNLVAGVNDPPRNSERTIWVDGVPAEVGRSTFAPDLSAVDDLHFAPEAARERRENLLIVRSSYRQPFGTFSGSLPGGIDVAEGYGVMEDHEVWW